MMDDSAIYSFSEGDMKENSARHELFGQDNLWHVTENGVETIYTENEFYYHQAYIDAQELQKNHTHTSFYTCFYDMTPCTLEEMVNYLNAYASVMSDG